ncbi:hypothetical protein [Reichenbachiella versicolor]|uniref:hypothetical protein n=1 Tax=Reichenbachiella versicolor TaxID=1821036 RepID=UPI0013A55A08|nr:hypothetical protein [Reichenbachiella versicolor]
MSSSLVRVRSQIITRPIGLSNFWDDEHFLEINNTVIPKINFAIAGIGYLGSLTQGAGVLFFHSNTFTEHCVNTKSRYHMDAYQSIV